MKRFEEALIYIKGGKKLARATWNDEFIFLVNGSTFNVNRLPLLGIYPEGTEINYHAHIDKRESNGMIVPWVPSQVDILADDWQIIE